MFVFNCSGMVNFLLWTFSFAAGLLEPANQKPTITQYDAKNSMPLSLEFPDVAIDSTKLLGIRDAALGDESGEQNTEASLAAFVFIEPCFCIHAAVRTNSIFDSAVRPLCGYSIGTFRELHHSKFT